MIPLMMQKDYKAQGWREFQFRNATLILYCYCHAFEQLIVDRLLSQYSACSWLDARDQIVVSITFFAAVFSVPKLH